MGLRESVSGLDLEKALQLEGHHLPVVSEGEGHPVAGGFGQQAGGGRLAELGPRVAGPALGGQERVQVGHRALPVLVVAAGGKTDGGVLLLRGRGLPCLWGPGVGGALAVAVVVVASAGPRQRCGRDPVLVPDLLLASAQMVAVLGQWALGVGQWNVVPLSTPHTVTLVVTSLLSEN